MASRTMVVLVVRRASSVDTSLRSDACLQAAPPDSGTLLSVRHRDAGLSQARSCHATNIPSVTKVSTMCSDRLERQGSPGAECWPESHRLSVYARLISQLLADLLRQADPTCRLEAVSGPEGAPYSGQSGILHLKTRRTRTRHSHAPGGRLESRPRMTDLAI